VLFVLGDRGDEDDRDVLRALALLDQLRRLEAVEQRHLDVEQDDRDVVEQQLAERLFGRMDSHRALIVGAGATSEQVSDCRRRADAGHPVLAASQRRGSIHSP
jgi:hypothetical protein